MRLAKFASTPPSSFSYMAAETDTEKQFQSILSPEQRQPTRYCENRLSSMCCGCDGLSRALVAVMAFSMLENTPLAAPFNQTQFTSDVVVDRVLAMRLTKKQIMLWTVAFTHILLEKCMLTPAHPHYDGVDEFVSCFRSTMFQNGTMHAHVTPWKTGPRQRYINPLKMLIKKVTKNFKLVDVRWPISNDNFSRLGMTLRGVTQFRLFMLMHIGIDELLSTLSVPDLDVLGSIVGTLFFARPHVVPRHLDSRNFPVVFCMKCRQPNFPIRIFNRRMDSRLTPVINTTSHDLCCMRCSSRNIAVIHMPGNIITLPISRSSPKADNPLMKIELVDIDSCPLCCYPKLISRTICHACHLKPTVTRTCHFSTCASDVKLYPITHGKRTVYACGIHCDHVRCNTCPHGMCK